MELLVPYNGMRKPHQMRCLSCGTHSTNTIQNLVLTRADGSYKVHLPCPACRGEKDYSRPGLDALSTALKLQILSAPQRTHSQSWMRVRCSACETERKLQARELYKLKYGCTCLAGNRPPTIDEIRSLGSQYGLHLVSAEYENSASKLRFRCHRAHEFGRSWDNLQKRGGGCPRCRTAHRSEAIVEFTVGRLYGCPFRKAHHAWNQNDRGKGMELDIFSDHARVLASLKGLAGDKGLAIEHQGVQHFEVIESFGMTEADLSRRKADDKRKMTNCLKAGVTLAYTYSPADPHGRGPSDVHGWQQHVIDALLRVGVKLPSAASEPIDYRPLWMDLYVMELEEAQQLCRAKGWTCRDEHGGNGRYKYTIWCGHPGHAPFRMKLSNLRTSRNGCQICVGQRDITRERLIETIGHRGRVISTDTDAGTTYATLECASCGHTWRTTGSSILKGSWCAECAHQRTRETGKDKRSRRLEQSRPVIEFLREILALPFIGEGWSHQAVADAIGAVRKDITRAVSEDHASDALLKMWSEADWREQLSGTPPGSVTLERERRQWDVLSDALRHLSQSEVARRTDIAQAHISEYRKQGRLTPRAVLTFERVGLELSEADRKMTARKPQRNRKRKARRSAAEMAPVRKAVLALASKGLSAAEIGRQLGEDRGAVARMLKLKQ